MWQNELAEIALSQGGRNLLRPLFFATRFLGPLALLPAMPTAFFELISYICCQGKRFHDQHLKQSCLVGHQETSLLSPFRCWLNLFVV